MSVCTIYSAGDWAGLCPTLMNITMFTCSEYFEALRQVEDQTFVSVISISFHAARLLEEDNGIMVRVENGLFMMAKKAKARGRIVKERCRRYECLRAKHRETFRTYTCGAYHSRDSETVSGIVTFAVDHTDNLFISCRHAASCSRSALWKSVISMIVTAAFALVDQVV